MFCYGVTTVFMGGNFFFFICGKRKAHGGVGTIYKDFLRICHIIYIDFGQGRLLYIKKLKLYKCIRREVLLVFMVIFLLYNTLIGHFNNGYESWRHVYCVGFIMLKNTSTIVGF